MVHGGVGRDAHNGIMVSRSGRGDARPTLFPCTRVLGSGGHGRTPDSFI
ncbi:MAG: hypothetical protein OZSIB_3354 [Candidatus Ozemobacter sibiricus]|uniref:Uncharacterized protein n=1 Tax=Candidatus Ozemobacter sibiricus TaxID=2268124 RepID=A0A367ZDS6_9BACT|nr:MAG: hypothetical protein OZSIB_3354 [Candidatus Ozemobacter sibiricus]